MSLAEIPRIADERGFKWVAWNADFAALQPSVTEASVDVGFAAFRLMNQPTLLSYVLGSTKLLQKATTCSGGEHRRTTEELLEVVFDIAKAHSHQCCTSIHIFRALMSLEPSAVNAVLIEFSWEYPRTRELQEIKLAAERGDMKRAELYRFLLSEPRFTAKKVQDGLVDYLEREYFPYGRDALLEYEQRGEKNPGQLIHFAATHLALQVQDENRV